MSGTFHSRRLGPSPIDRIQDRKVYVKRERLEVAEAIFDVFCIQPRCRRSSVDCSCFAHTFPSCNDREFEDNLEQDYYYDMQMIELCSRIRAEEDAEDDARRLAPCTDDWYDEGEWD